MKLLFYANRAWNHIIKKLGELEEMDCWQIAVSSFLGFYGCLFFCFIHPFSELFLFCVWVLNSYI
jgi:hypothetical protein